MGEPVGWLVRSRGSSGCGKVSWFANRLQSVSITPNSFYLKFVKLNIKRSEIPAVTYVDYSARIQTVSQKTNKKYYDLIFANILFGPLTSLAPRLKFISKPNSFIVLSGLLSNQITNIVNRYKMFGFKFKKKIIINGWGTVIMRRQF